MFVHLTTVGLDIYPLGQSLFLIHPVRNDAPLGFKSQWLEFLTGLTSTVHHLVSLTLPPLTRWTPCRNEPEIVPATRRSPALAGSGDEDLGRKPFIGQPPWPAGPWKDCICKKLHYPYFYNDRILNLRRLIPQRWGSVRMSLRHHHNTI